MVKIAADREICTGAGMCALTAPGLFEQDDQQGLVVVRSQPLTPEEVDAARKAVGLCPSGALSLEDDE